MLDGGVIQRASDEIAVNGVRIKVNKKVASKAVADVITQDIHRLGGDQTLRHGRNEQRTRLRAGVRAETAHLSAVGVPLSLTLSASFSGRNKFTRFTP